MSTALLHSKTTLHSAHPATDARSKALLSFARAHGFAIRTTRTQWQGSVLDVESEDIKTLLRAAGFADRDFHLYLEYQRGWGFL